MLFPTPSFLCIVLATAVTLNEHGITEDPGGAGRRSLCVRFCRRVRFAVFALGIIGMACWAPVLAGPLAVMRSSAGKRACHTVSRPAGGFYAIIITASTRSARIIDQ